MKKMRWLAFMLCIMMIVCALPVLQASAAVGDLDASVAIAMGVNSAINVYEQVIDENYASSDVSSTSTISTYTENGLQIGTSTGPQSWSLAPSNDFWTNANAVVVKMKLGQDANDRITIRTEAGTRKNTTRDDGTAQSIGKVILAGGVVYAGSKSYPGVMGEANFKPGFDWFELMIVHNTESFDVWVKNNPADTTACSTTGGQWAKLTFEGDLLYEQGHAGVGTSKNDHFGIVQDVSTNEVTYGSNENPAYLKSVSVFQADNRVLTIEDALADRAGISDGMIASSNVWNFANSTMTSYTRDGYNSISSPEGAAFTNEGLDLSETNGTDVWKFSAYTGWSPVANRNTIDAFRALYVKVKGDVTIGYLMSDGKAIDKLRSVPGQSLTTSNAYAMDGTTSASGSRDGFNANPTVDNNWIEYLIIPRNTNASYVYAKSATLTNNAWVKAVSIDRYCYSSGTSDPNYDTYRRNGISFEGNGVVEQFRTIEFNTAERTLVAADAATIPASATYLHFEEEFKSTPTHSNVSLGSAVTVADGVAVATTRYANEAEGIEATSGTLNYSNLEIPLNGYLEVKMKSNGVKTLSFVDESTKYELTMNCDYSDFGGTPALYGGYIADSDMAWRIWRFVRTADGYSVYSKGEGDSGWRMHTSNAIADAGETSKRIRFNFYGNADGVSDGNGMIDYIRIYGSEAYVPDSGEGGGGSGEGEEPKPEVDVMDTIQEVLQDGVKRSAATAGDTVAKEKTDDMYASSHDWNFANSTMETYYRSGNGSLALPEGAELTAEGLDLSGTNGIGEWKYSPHSGWAFVNGAGGSNTVLRAGYVKVKGDVTISFTGAEHRRLISVHTKPNTATTSGLDTKATTFVPDTGWVEYIFVARNSNSINIWAKKVTDAVWTYYGNSGTTEQISDATPNNGLHFSGTGVVALWKTFEFNENGYSAGYPDIKLIAANGETTPATANTLVYGAEFDAAPERAVLGAASSVENGVLSAKTTVANESLGTVAAKGDITFRGVKIPENGYAEFKAKNNGAIEVLFDDGTNQFSMNRYPADNYDILGTSIATFGNFVNDSDMAWRTYRLVRTAEGYSLYSKAEGDTGWRIMSTAAEARKKNSDGNARIYFRFHTNCDGVSVGNGQLDYLRVYGTQADKEEFEKEEEPETPGGGDTPETVVVDTIYEVLQEGVSKSSATQGEAVAKVKTDNLYATTHDWNFENSTMETYSRTGNGSLKMPEGAAFTAEGLDLSGTQGNGEWKYFPHASWAFVNANTGSNVTFRAGYVKVKGKVTISFTGSEHKRLIKVYTEPNVATASGLDAKATTFVPDDGWVEYIFIPKNSNSINIWAKKASDAVWTYCGTSGTTELVTDASLNRGLHFSGTGVVALWKTFEFNENGYNAGYPDKKTIATEKEATPENADTLWFSEEFDQEITYFPSPVLGAASSVANGVLDTKTTVKNDSLGTVNAEGTLQYDGLVIPVGGYAEFKAKGNGTIEVLFDDGTNQFTMHRLPADNYSIRGTAYTTFANFVNDSDMAWRTYRVVRTAEGYSFYSKAEGDTGWRIMGTASEESKLASDGKGARIYFRFHTNCDGVSVGNGQLDYLRIYGVAPDAPLTLTDGYTTTPVAKGATLEYPEYLRIIPGKGVTEGKVIICNYDGKVLKGMKTIDVSELADGGSVNVFDEDNNTIKLFLWDSIEGMKSLSTEVLKVQY